MSKSWLVIGGLLLIGVPSVCLGSLFVTIIFTGDIDSFSRFVGELKFFRPGEPSYLKSISGSLVRALGKSAIFLSVLRVIESKRRPVS